MKKFVKFLIVILVIALVGVSVISLAGCSDSNTLLVATNSDFKPFEFMEGNNIVGYDIDVINAVGAELGMKVKIVDMPFDSIIGKVQSDARYIAVAGMTRSVKREKQVSFTKKYFTDNQYQVYIVKEGDTTFDGVTTKAEADARANDSNKTIYAAMGQTGQYYVEGNEDQFFDGLSAAKLAVLDGLSSCIEKIEVNKSFAIGDISAAKAICEKKPGYKIIDIPLSFEEYCIGVNKKATKLLEKINTAIDTLIANGTIEQIRVKWLG